MTYTLTSIDTNKLYHTTTFLVETEYGPLAIRAYPEQLIIFNGGEHPLGSPMSPPWTPFTVRGVPWSVRATMTLEETLTIKPGNGRYSREDGKRSSTSGAGSAYKTDGPTVKAAQRLNAIMIDVAEWLRREHGEELYLAIFQRQVHEATRLAEQAQAEVERLENDLKVARKERSDANEALGNLIYNASLPNMSSAS